MNKHCSILTVIFTICFISTCESQVTYFEPKNIVTVNICQHSPIYIATSTVVFDTCPIADSYLDVATGLSGQTQSLNPTNFNYAG